MTNSKLFLSLLLAGTIGSVSAQSLKDAKAALTAEQYDKAKVILQNLVEKKAKDGENYFYLGKVHIINDKIDSAAIVFNEGLTNAPKEQLNNVGLGIVDLLSGNQSAAEAKFATAVTGLGRKDYLPLLYIGEAYIQAPKPDYTKAIEYLTQAKEKNQKDPFILIALGDAYAGLGESSQAFVNYRDAEYMDTNLLAPKIGQAVISRRAQAYDVVLEELTLLQQSHPDYAPIYRELAETYYLSSLKAPEEQYRELNAKAVENYKKYLSLTGDNSIEAKTRYADFLVYSGNYDELKTVSTELATMPGVDAKIYRYLGYTTYLQDKDYPKAAEYMNKLFSEVPKERLIARDFFYGGLANLSINNDEKGLEYLKEAVARQTEEDNIETDISETAFAKYQDGEIDVAIKLFAIPASQPESDYYYDANYYIGLGEYSQGRKIIDGAQEGEDKREEAKPKFDAAVKAFDIVLTGNKEEIVDRYHASALYHKAYSLLAQEDLGDLEGLSDSFVDPFTKLLAFYKDKPVDDKNRAYILDANNYLGVYAFGKGEVEKAKAYFDAVLAINPADEFALQFQDYL